MKQIIKGILVIGVVGAMCMALLLFSGCGLTDKLDKVIEQAQCTHNWNDGEETKASTCQEKGVFTKTCTLCGKTQNSDLPLSEHTESSIPAVAATCTTPGLTDGVQCSVCGYVIVSQNAIPAKGHTVIVDEELPATCESAGKTEGAHCDTCKQVLVAQQPIAATGHYITQVTGYEPTCENTGYTGGTKCANCDVTTTGEIIPALGHDWNDGEITRASTCVKNGIKTYTCATCAGTKTQTLELSSHTYVNGVCSECGHQIVVYTLSGTWKFDWELSIPENPIREYVEFTIDDVAYDIMDWRVRGAAYRLSVGFGQTLDVQLYNSETGWSDDKYKTIIFDGTASPSR